MSAIGCSPPPPPPPPPPNNLPEWATKLSVNRSKLEKALKRQKGRLYALFSFIKGVFSSLAFRESAKIAFAQSQNKLKACQKKANYEDGLVRNLEMARDVLLNANQTS